ncbi:SDR family NAD(P)-dependent oxidoreductase [Sphingobium sp. H39-3-25]|uniref:SDR family NAD(P)-dependent oxidoreductase n=1 Tax=Sphingobium arseniciresistens TaxID=3030834 RepID=UPI0023B9849F|nr:SDR family NAD(P)-dependent oxidoreductase [Sphingobium arseniciresistens]
MAVLPKTPSFRLDGRRALVTGASRGIGAALGVALADAGAAVTLVARGMEAVQELASAIRAGGGQAEAVSLDVRDLEAVSAYLGQAEAFDILINNAGTNRPMPMMRVSEADYDAVLNLNLKSSFFIAQGVAGRLIESGKSGSMIHIGSQMGHVGGPNRSLYCASKWAIEGMSKAFALDLAQYGIRSNVIAPTFIETPMTKPFFEDPAFKASVLQKIKIGRLGQVEDLMGAALFLASDASALMTGTSLVVDGGWTAE